MPTNPTHWVYRQIRYDPRLKLTHKINVQVVPLELFDCSFYCYYDNGHRTYLLWAGYTKGEDRRFNRTLAFFLFNHLNYAPDWAKFHSKTKTTPVTKYWEDQFRVTYDRLRQGFGHQES